MFIFRTDQELCARELRLSPTERRPKSDTGSPPLEFASYKIRQLHRSADTAFPPVGRAPASSSLVTEVLGGRVPGAAKLELLHGRNELALHLLWDQVPGHLASMGEASMHLTSATSACFAADRSYRCEPPRAVGSAQPPSWASTRASLATVVVVRGCVEAQHERRMGLMREAPFVGRRLSDQECVAYMGVRLEKVLAATVVCLDPILGFGISIGDSLMCHIISCDHSLVIQDFLNQLNLLSICICLYLQQIKSYVHVR
jgi:hypothetical protein